MVNNSAGQIAWDGALAREKQGVGDFGEGDRQGLVAARGKFVSGL